MDQTRIAESMHKHTGVLEASLQKHGGALSRLARRLTETFHAGGRLVVIGSGQFGAVADLVASFFNYRLSLERPVLPAVSLCRDSMLGLSLGRDDQLQQFFSRQLQALGGGGDLVLAFSDGARDEAVEEAFAVARGVGSSTAFVFRGREEAFFGEKPDFLFDIETDSTADALEVSHFCGRVLCELVEAELFGL
ncbi:D-sedoheptulose-7-phosphate isomerase [Geoalkalibacter subterraneus]|jgi:D-sedoheptulose 7-phosphate isomerase|uniref:SIS domain-containing protein n=1 Tax=Geoalkalibacter subterraneus TaxID=483547 RepID=A0A0B5FNN5_9BACT|nr:SIS domain-containing protein [Geoalkalibacter subterraneus]AJF05630.1 hypothetical protein GSUB_02310 [Geoalkalibacter subterraneus]